MATAPRAVGTDRAVRTARRLRAGYLVLGAPAVAVVANGHRPRAAFARDRAAPRLAG
jgi:hypothetical protein